MISLCGVAGNLAIVLLYVLTRTYGVPLGPHAAQIEVVGALDVTATGMELGIVFALLTLLDGACRRVVVNTLLALGVLLWALRMAGVIV